jgi:hypothetical protein
MAITCNGRIDRELAYAISCQRSQKGLSITIIAGDIANALGKDASKRANIERIISDFERDGIVRPPSGIPQKKSYRRRLNTLARYLAKIDTAPDAIVITAIRHAIAPDVIKYELNFEYPP